MLNIPIPLEEVLALLLVSHLATLAVVLFLLDVVLVVRVAFVHVVAHALVGIALLS